MILNQYAMIDERLSRALLTEAEISLVASIFDELDHIGSPTERLERILRFSISQTVHGNTKRCYDCLLIVVHHRHL